LINNSNHSNNYGGNSRNRIAHSVQRINKWCTSCKSCAVCCTL
jgi:hypothetical protein